MGKKSKGDLIVGTAIILVGLLFFVSSIRLGLKGPEGISGPGSGFFPFICSAFTMFFGAWIVFDSIRKGSVDFFGQDPEQHANFKTIYKLIAAFAVFLLIWLFVDFFLGVALLCLFLNYNFGRTWKFNIIFTAILVALLYGVFDRLLDIQFAF